MLCFSRIAKSSVPFGMLAFLLLVPAKAFSYSQAEAQQYAVMTNAKGSDDDQDLAYRNAMKAFMNLAALNIPGAISKGYEAYGNYTNSEKLDDLEARTKGLRNNMDSSGNIITHGSGVSGSGGASQDSGVSGTVQKRVTSMGNLDPSRLYKGETAAVAEEFEKRSGMKREEFLKHLAAATDAHYTWDDPGLMGKLEQRWQGFKSRIPNKEFLAGLEKAEAMTPEAARLKMMAEAQAFYKDQWKSGGSSLATAPSIPAAASATQAAAAAATPASTTAQTLIPAAGTAATAEAAAGGNRVIASLNAPDADGVYPKVGMYIGLNQGDDALKALVGANFSAEDMSIFQSVSLRYKKLTPMLLGKISKDAR